MSWHEFKILFRKKYLLERYYDSKAKEFYEINMESMIGEEYITKFLGLLRYVLYLKDAKAKVHKFVSGLPLEPRSLEEVIGKLKH